MIILSQNKEIIINTNTMIALYVNECDIRCLVDYDEDSYGFILGSYKNKEKAEYVLNFIFTAIKDKMETIDLSVWGSDTNA